MLLHLIIQVPIRFGIIIIVTSQWDLLGSGSFHRQWLHRQLSHWQIFHRQSFHRHEHFTDRIISLTFISPTLISPTFISLSTSLILILISGQQPFALVTVYHYYTRLLVQHWFHFTNIHFINTNILHIVLFFFVKLSVAVVI